jgi:undecaprenyl diphosphate synthase
MLKQRKVPRHIAIVMDGNGRWAKKRFMPRLVGHKKGVETVRKIIRQCNDLGVECLTLFAFSSENWKRPPEEVNGLMALFISALEREAKALYRNQVQLKFIGDISRFPNKLQKAIADVEQLTSSCTGMKLLIAANYGGRWDIVQSVQQLAKKVQSGELKAEDITEGAISSLMATSLAPDLDLFIRTGGESRVSNFLLWQLAYSELYFSDALWPDFNEHKLMDAINDYAGRQRRFGKTGDQVKGEVQNA